MGLKIKKVFKSVAKVVTAPVKAVAKAIPVVANLPGSPLQVAGAIHGTFEKLFNRSSQNGQVEVAPQPVPFQLPPATANPSLSGVQGVLSQTLQQLYGLISPGALPPSITGGSFDQVLGNLQQVLGTLGGTGSGNANGASLANPSSFASGAGKVDNLMKEAERLLLSDNKADQLRGQRMMQDAQNLFQMLSQLLKAQADMQRAAISNMRV